MFRGRRYLSAAACCAYPVLSHLAALDGEWCWSAAGLALLGWAAASLRLRPAAAALVGSLTLAVAWAAGARFPQALLYAPPLAIYLGLGALFAATLRPGREPLVSAFARLEHDGGLPADVARYTRTLTVLWTGFFAVMAGTSLFLALHGPVALWSLFTNGISYALLALFFAGEYLFRRMRFRHYRHAGLVDFLRRLPRYRVW